MSVDEKQALDMVKDSLKCNNGSYEVGIPWKDGTPDVTSNYHVAMERLDCTERKL